MLIASKLVSDVAGESTLWSCVCERGLDAGAGRQAVRRAAVTLSVLPL